MTVRVLGRWSADPEQPAAGRDFDAVTDDVSRQIQCLHVHSLLFLVVTIIISSVCKLRNNCIT